MLVLLSSIEVVCQIAITMWSYGKWETLIMRLYAVRKGAKPIYHLKLPKAWGNPERDNKGQREDWAGARDVRFHYASHHVTHHRRKQMLPICGSIFMTCSPPHQGAQTIISIMWILSPAWRVITALPITWTQGKRGPQGIGAGVSRRVKHGLVQLPLSFLSRVMHFHSFMWTIILQMMCHLAPLIFNQHWNSWRATASFQYFHVELLGEGLLGWKPGAPQVDRTAHSNSNQPYP